MAKGSMMLQIAVEQLLSAAVTAAPEIWAVAVDSLDGDRTTVREIATEKSHQFYGWANPGHEFGELQFTANALTDVWLAFPDLRRPPAILHAPLACLFPAYRRGAAGSPTGSGLRLRLRGCTIRARSESRISCLCGRGCAHLKSDAS